MPKDSQTECHVSTPYGKVAKELKPTVKTLREFANKEGARTSKLRILEEIWTVGFGRTHGRDPCTLWECVPEETKKRGVKTPKTWNGKENHDRLLKMEMRQRFAYLGARGWRSRWTRVVQSTKEIQSWTLDFDGIDTWQRYVHSGKSISKKIERRSAKTPKTRTPK